MPHDRFPSYVRELIEHLECQIDGNASLIKSFYSFLMELPIEIILSVV